jgi:hypothetical protein
VCVCVCVCVLECTALCRLMMMKEGALNACQMLLQNEDPVLSTYCLKAITLYAQNQYRKLPANRCICFCCHKFESRWLDTNCCANAAEAVPKLIDPKTIAALVKCCASKNVRGVDSHSREQTRSQFGGGGGAATNPAKCDCYDCSNLVKS